MVGTREGLPDLKTGVTELVFHVVGKMPSSKERLNSINNGNSIE